MNIELSDALTIIRWLVGMIILVGGALGYSVNDSMNKSQEITYTQQQVEQIAETYSKHFCGKE